MIALYCLSLLGAVALEEEASDSRCETMWLRGVQVWLWARSPGGDDALLVGHSWWECRRPTVPFQEGTVSTSFNQRMGSALPEDSLAFSLAPRGGFG